MVEDQRGLSRRHYFEHYNDDEFILRDTESDADDVPSRQAGNIEVLVTVPASAPSPVPVPRPHDDVCLCVVAGQRRCLRRLG